jgi:hypothetical protein
LGELVPGKASATPAIFLYMKRIFFSIALVAFSLPGFTADRVYQTPESFVEQAFAGQPPKPQVIWLTGDIRDKTTEILGHAPAVLRLRYWHAERRSTWILEEIGKEKPITTGFIVEDDELKKVKVLIFRESRGWEVERDAFAKQYHGATLTEDMQLNRHIDGISGATLSVNAINKLSRLALYLHQQIMQKQTKG